MRNLRSYTSKCAHEILHALGYDFVNIKRSKFGHDILLDIGRMVSAWDLSVEHFFDVGANDGSTSALVFSSFPNTNIFAFEPHHLTFARLIHRMRDQPRFHPFRLALGSEIGARTLFEYDLSSVNSLISNARFAVRFKTESSKSVSVECTTIDRFCEQHGIEKIDVLKIDTEGFEYNILRGAINLIRSGSIRFIYFEFNDVFPLAGTCGGALAPVAEIIAPYGYRFVASYTDYVSTEGEMFGVSNALFVLPPR